VVVAPEAGRMALFLFVGGGGGGAEGSALYSQKPSVCPCSVPN